MPQLLQSRRLWIRLNVRCSRKRGGQLIETAFKGHKAHHWFRDSDGNKFRARPINVRRGQWSPFQTSAVKDRITLWDFFEGLARQNGCTLVSEKYVNED